MQIIKGSILDGPAAHGKLSLQVPELVIWSVPEYEEVPDEWLVRLKSGENRVVIGREQGFLHLTEAGLAANRDALRKIWVENGWPWEKFEQYAKRRFEERNENLQKEVARRKKKFQQAVAALEAGS